MFDSAELISNLTMADNSFAVAKRFAILLSDEKNQLDARRVAIHVIDMWDSIPVEAKPFWTDIIEALGFYPYLEKYKDKMPLHSLADEIRKESFQSPYLPQKTYMHKDQKKLSDYLLAGQNVVASAPTSFGKSLLIEELVASRKYRNIVIIQPTLALLDETRIKMKKYSDDYKIIVRTSQEATTDKGNLFLLTAERVMEYEAFPHIGLLIIDEFYKMSLRRIDERASVLNNAFLRLYNQFQCKFYLLGPNISGITSGFAEKYNAIFYKTDYSLVDCEVELIETDQTLSSQSAKDKSNTPKLFTLLDSLHDQQTLIYCSTPARARRMAREYLEHLKQQGVEPTTWLPLIDWLNKDLLKDWSVSRALTFGIAVHDGSLPKHIGASIIHYFGQGHIRCIFCTSTIIEGVNTSAKNVIIFDDRKGNRLIDYFDYSNIRGRAGRLMEHQVGKVWSFASIPAKNEPEIDIPFHEQDVEILSDEILINIPPIDIQPQVKERHNELNQIDATLLKIIRKNGVSVNGQMNIYYALEHDVRTESYSSIAWSFMPNWDKILYVLELANNNTFRLDDSGLSVKQLAFHLNKYRQHGSIMKIAISIFQGKEKKLKNPMTPEQRQSYIDKAIEEAFHIYRSWFKYIIPKAFSVVDSLQVYVCAKHGLKAGSYSYFVQQLENDFTRGNMSILIEYGIPSETVKHLASIIPDSLNEDDVITFIKRYKDRIYSQLSEYEVERLEQCL